MLNPDSDSIEVFVGISRVARRPRRSVATAEVSVGESRHWAGPGLVILHRAYRIVG